MPLRDEAIVRRIVVRRKYKYARLFGQLHAFFDEVSPSFSDTFISFFLCHSCDHFRSDLATLL